MQKPWLLVYCVLSVFHLLAAQAHWEIGVLVSKPLLITVLAAWFWKAHQPFQARTTWLLFIGLLFSIGGDSLLMLVEYGPKQPLFFLLGLGSFLVTQLCYTAAFASMPGAGFLRKRPVWSLPFLVYLALMIAVLWPKLDAGLRGPVCLYALAIVSMALAALNTKDALSPARFNLFFGSVLLFVLSDSLIAINKFVTPIPLAGLAIMVTYLVAQYGIAVFGAARRNGGGEN